MNNTLDYFLNKLETVDNMTKNELENSIVNIGTEAIPELVNKLQIVRGIQRGVVAMSLIRIGSESIKYLEKAAEENTDFEWIARYLISEITCQAA